MPSRSCKLLPTLLALTLAGCTGNTPDPDTGEPKEDTFVIQDTFSPVDTGLLLPPLDTSGDALGDDVPPTTMLIRYEGWWNLSPAGGPIYDAMSGTIAVIELVDGRSVDTSDTGDLPSCEANFSLTGDRLQNHSCTACDFVFNVRYFLTAGDPTMCQDRDAPEHDTYYEMGWSSVNNAVMLNVASSGVWVPWYEGVRQGDRIDLTFERQLGWVDPNMEEE